MKVVIESLIEGARRAHGTVVVIDVLRAFTTASVVFQRGADRIVMVAEVEEALTLRDRGAADICIGEVDGRKPDGFDYGNSPHELAAADLSGKVIAQSTRAGTTGVVAAAATGVQRLFAGALVNAVATATVVATSRPERVTLVAMGAWGATRSDEDEQCALYIKNLLQGRRPNPVAVQGLVAAGEESEKYHNPTQDQYHPEDLEMALRIDSVDFAIEIERRDGLLVARPVES
jgi:2-phosphosulfolactate phosphatase